MENIEKLEDSQTQEFYFYFDTKESHLTKDEVITAIKSLDIIITDIAKHFPEFGKIDFIILPSENGSFKIKTTLIMVGTLYIGILSTDTFNVILKKTTGKTHIEYVEQGITKGIELVDFISGWFSTPIKELQEIIPESINLDKALKAKSNLFSVSLNNNNILGVNFNKEKDGLINKQHFPAHIIDTIRRNLDPIYQYMTLQIHRPVLIDTKEKGKKGWGFINEYDKKFITCDILDSNFHASFLKGEHPLKESHAVDVIKCEIETMRELVDGEEKILVHNILEIYQFNDKLLAPEPIDFNDTSPIHKVASTKKRQRNHTQLSLLALASIRK